MHKYCEPNKRMSVVTICNQKCCSVIDREIVVLKLSPKRGRYRVGSFLMSKPFGTNKENLINFCMDETLDKG